MVLMTMLERLAQKQDAADLATGLGLVGVSLEGMDRAADAIPFHEAAMSVANVAVYYLRPS